MHGNVREWVEDCYQWNYEGAPQDGSASTREGCRTRAQRDGTWAYPRSMVGAAERSWGSQSGRSFEGFDGFRVARAVPSSHSDSIDRGFDRRGGPLRAALR